MTIAKNTSQFVETEIDDEVVLMDLQSGDFFSLAGTSLDVWRLIDGTRSESQIVTALAADYGQSTGQIAPDVAAFLRELAEMGLIKR